MTAHGLGADLTNVASLVLHGHAPDPEDPRLRLSRFRGRRLCPASRGRHVVVGVRGVTLVDDLGHEALVRGVDVAAGADDVQGVTTEPRNLKEGNKSKLKMSSFFPLIFYSLTECLTILQPQNRSYQLIRSETWILRL